MDEDRSSINQQVLKELENTQDYALFLESLLDSITDSIVYAKDQDGIYSYYKVPSALKGQNQVLSSIERKGRTDLDIAGFVTDPINRTSLINNHEQDMNVISDGKIFAEYLPWLDIRKFPLFGKNKEVIGMTARITNRGHIKMIEDNLNDGIILMNREGLIISANREAELILGYTNAELHRRHLREMYRIFDDCHKPIAPLLDQIREKENTLDRQQEVLLLDRYGHEHIIHERYCSFCSNANEVDAISLIITDISENRKINRAIANQASFDRLTGFLNRMAFERQLREYLADSLVKQKSHSLIYLDVDGFDVINQECGYFAADQLLKEISRIIKNNLRKVDILSRFEADSFAILLPNCNMHAARQLSGRVHSALNQYSFRWDGKSYPLAVSAGLCIIGRSHEEMEEIIYTAQKACFHAKEKGGGQIVLADESFTTSVALEEERTADLLKKALEEKSFRFAALPVFNDPRKQSVLYKEIFLRMLDDNGFVHQPDYFFPIARQFRLLKEIDYYVIEEVIRKLDMLHQNVGINITDSTLMDENIFSHLMHLVQKYSISPEQLYFEIDERSIRDHFNSVKEFTDRVRSWGARVVIDNVSLNLLSCDYISVYQADLVKINSNLIKDTIKCNISLKLLKSIVEIAHERGYKVIAKHLEREETLNQIKDIDFDYFQGYSLGQGPEVF